ARVSRDRAGMNREALVTKMRSRRQLLLQRLANLPTSHRALQRLMEEFEPETPTLLENAQKDLQKIWPKSTPLAVKQSVVDAWLIAATKRLFAGVSASAGLRARLATGS